jgi:putative ABC transport system permease protein
MTHWWVLFLRLMLRPLRRETLRTMLTILAVALGVAVVVAIDLAGQAAAGSFHSSLESLAGKNDLQLNATGGLDQNLLGRLAQLPYAFDFSPRITDFASIDGKGEALPFIGLDLIGHPGKQQMENNGLSGQARDLNSGNPIWVGKQLGLHTGQQVRLLINDRLHVFTVRGVLQHSKGEIGEDTAIVADIGLAQQVTGKPGKLDDIDVRIPPVHSLTYWKDYLRKQLPASVNIDTEGSRTDENRKMLAAFRWNLHVLSYIALIVGAFLIYNTIAVSVVRRRNEIGIVRALGMTRNAITQGFLAEALFYGCVGSVIGLFLGRLLAIGAVQLVGNTVQALYVSSQPAPTEFSFGGIVTGLAIGIGVSVLAALAPALEAARLPPIEAMARGREEYLTRVRSRRTVYLALLLFALAGICSEMPAIDGQPILAYLAAILLVGATALAIPNLVTMTESLTSRLVSKLFDVEALLALRGLRASLGRTSIMTAALATAIAMTASVGIMVGSFRETVWLWMNNQLKADFYLRPAGSAAADRHPTMSASIPDAIERLPGVETVDRFRVYPIFYQGLPASLGGDEISRRHVSAATNFLPGEDRDAILRKLPTGNYAMVSEPFANKHHVHVGDVLRLSLAGAARPFQVLGIYYDYSTERGFIVVDRNTLLKYLPDPAVSNLAVYLNPNADENQVRREIGGVIAGRAVLVFTNRKLRSEAIAIFDRSFRITYALEAVAVTVAVLGIAGALLALVIDRRREFALLRFLGAAQGQIRRIILCEAGLLGLLATAAGLVLGTLLSLILVFVINKQSFGWTIQFHWPIGLLAAALAGIYVATVLAGLYPARTAMRMNPIEVIHEE